ncbi:MAG: hypothetical protein ACQEV7_05855 [Bacillota bacterium]
MHRNSRKQKLMLVLCLGTVLLALLYFNPSEQNYEEFSEQEYGLPPDDVEMDIERINFFFFSTYTPVVYSEKGITHLGIMEKFILISDGQFGYPVWLGLFD